MTTRPYCHSPWRTPQHPSLASEERCASEPTLIAFRPATGRDGLRFVGWVLALPVGVAVFLAVGITIINALY